MSLDILKSRLFVASFGLSIASTVAVFQPFNSQLREIGKFSLGASIASVAIAETVTSKAYKFSEKEQYKLKDDIRDKDKEITQLTKQIDKASRQNELSLTTLSSEIASLSRDLNNTKSELVTNRSLLDSKDFELRAAFDSVHQLQAKLKDVGKFSEVSAYKMVRDTYNRSVLKLEAHINALMRNYSEVADELNNVLLDVDKFKVRWNEKIDNYEHLTSFNDLLDSGLEYQQKIIEGCIELRVKGQTIAIRYLDGLLENAVPVSLYENDLSNLTVHSDTVIKQLKNENESEVRAIVSDWVQANNQHEENYKTNYTEVINNGKTAVALLQQREALIKQLQDEITELRKPWTFTGTIDYAVAGNAIINFYYSAYGYVLDAMAWQETEAGYTLTFHTVRNKVYLTADMLHDKDNREQLAGLTNALQLPIFTPNYQSGLMVLEVVIRKPNKKAPIEKLESDINKIWVSADKFESFVKRFERVRITAGSTGGKSPTAKNLALAIMKSRNGDGEIKLYDPQHGSKKDYWNMPKAGTSHEDNLQGMQELCSLIDSRRHGSNHKFVLYVFDEVDNTVTTLKEGYKFKDLIKVSLKEGSHANTGAIYIGQSCDVTEVPGMTHSNWNNAVQFHIGSNAGLFIERLSTITTEEKTRLLEQYRKIQEYCDSKNQELGLDVFTDATAYRFALVVPLTGLPKFIQLPDFDTYNYYEVMKATSKAVVSEPEVKPVVTVKCPHCGSEKFSSIDASKHKYRCNKVGCRKYFTNEISTNSN